MTTDQGILGGIVRELIRPWRIHYSIQELGPEKQPHPKGTRVRQDQVITNHKQQNIQLSHYFIAESPSQNLIIYLHGNSGCRADFRHHINTSLDNGFSLVLFDFAGSGLSQGQFVTLGINETQDLAAVMTWVGNNLPYENLFLWGRSMGAVTALRYCSIYQKGIAGVVADSPFVSFKEMLCDVGDSMSFLPKFVYYPAAEVLGMWIKSKHGFDLREVDIERNMQQVECPVIFVHSTDDEIIPSSHSELLYERHQKEKKMLYIGGKHNELRSQAVVEECMRFLTRRTMKITRP